MTTPKLKPGAEDLIEAFASARSNEMYGYEERFLVSKETFIKNFLDACFWTLANLPKLLEANWILVWDREYRKYELKGADWVKTEGHEDASPIAIIRVNSDAKQEGGK